MRVCASACGFSTRTLGMANGMSTSPMPSSKSASTFGSGAKIEMMVGAALRCSQEVGLPASSRPTSIRSIETAWK